MKLATHALVIKSNGIIENVGSELDMIKQHGKLMKLYGMAYGYWEIRSLSAAQLENYYKREPGELAIYEDTEHLDT